MTEAIESLFFYLATYIPIAPVILFLLSYKIARSNRVLQFVALYSAIEFTTNVLTLFIESKALVMLYSIFTLAEYTLFALIFYSLIESLKVKKSIIFLSIGFYVFWVLYKIYGTYSALDSIPIGVLSILTLTYSFCFLYEQMAKLNDTFLYNRYSFWITAGIMFYLAGSFFSYLYSNQLDKKTIAVFWMFTNICASLKNIFFVIAILLYKNEKKTSSLGRLQGRFNYNPTP